MVGSFDSGIIDNMKFQEEESEGLKLSNISSGGGEHPVFIVGREKSNYKNPFIHHCKGNFWDLFKAISTLGQGCLGVVKKCERISTKEIVAVKIIRTRDEEKIQGVGNSNSRSSGNSRACKN